MRNATLIVQVTVFVMLILVLTGNAGSDDAKARLFTGSIFSLLGVLLLLINNKVTGKLYANQFSFNKKHQTKQKFQDGIKYGGHLLLSTGVAVIFFSVVL